ncbi:hypothetical protein VNO77_49999 [Canavalia gladiata]|uniref:Uncharacterized protein n=1 Tax=Canavalia gladiata TaxID=3824 RepID=A0AAN9JCM2_CANGL
MTDRRRWAYSVSLLDSSNTVTSRMVGLGYVRMLTDSRPLTELINQNKGAPSAFWSNQIYLALSKGKSEKEEIGLLQYQSTSISYAAQRGAIGEERRVRFPFPVPAQSTNNNDLGTRPLGGKRGFHDPLAPLFAICQEMKSFARCWFFSFFLIIRLRSALALLTIFKLELESRLVNDSGSCPLPTGVGSD